jgi:putative protease
VKRPEVLAPAGDLTSLRAALAAGADAVYFGLSDGFNARARAAGITRAELASVVAECHRAGAKVCLTLNTLIFESELEALEAILRDVSAAGVDALIVQDPAVALLARAVCATQELHASTQMTISSAEGVRFARALGITRVVLPRELSLKEIRRLRAESEDMELEVFVHGALCVSWSGQCLTSEAWGGRSANRGQCAQSCRMPYDLYVDGEHRPLGDVKYLLSPKDLAAFRALPELAEIGVHTLKIEGRYKGPAYVVAAVEAYRRWAAASVRPGGPTPDDEAQVAVDLNDLGLVYSRGFSDGFLGGADHQHLVEGRSPKHRGVFLGIVRRVRDGSVEVERAPSQPRTGGLAIGGAEAVGQRSDALHLLGGSATDATGAAPAAPQPRAGMGVVFDAGRPEDTEEPGGPIFAVESTTYGFVLGFGRPGPDLARVTPGQRVWLTGDPALERRARRLLEQPVSGRLALELSVSGEAGAPLVVEARGAGRRVVVQSEGLLAEAAGRGLDAQLLLEKLGALGGTAWHVDELDVRALKPGLHLPVAALKTLRRQLVVALDAAAPPPRVLDPRPALPRLRVPLAPAAAPKLPMILPVCRTDAQVEAVLAAGLPVIELDWMEREGLERALRRARAAGLRVHIATPRVQKPGEEGFDRRIARLEPDGVLIRHLGALMHFKEHPEDRRPELHGDFSLNITNSLTAAHFLSLGLDSITAAHDFDATQLLEMIPHLAVDRLVVTVHHHIPTFHTEHCIYAHLMSGGRDIRSCGQPCQTHEIALGDHHGQQHPVVVDPACRNTVYNARAQSAAGLVPRLLGAGVRRVRLEFVRETTEETLRVLAGYQALLSGDLSPRQLIEKLKLHEQFGVTAGTMRTLTHG